MENDAKKVLTPSRGPQGRVDSLDIELAELDARIDRNRAELERNNAKLAAKIAQMLKRLEWGG